jgi:hypothetical protein
MQSVPTIAFRRIRGSDELEAGIRARLAKLETFCPSLVGASVLVELPERRRKLGNRYRVRIELTVPRQQIVVTHQAALRAELRVRSDGKTRKQDEPDPGHRYAKVAVREAFEAARRRLQDYVRKQRGDVKTHAPMVRRRAS